MLFLPLAIFLVNFTTLYRGTPDCLKIKEKCEVTVPRAFQNSWKCPKFPKHPGSLKEFSRAPNCRHFLRRVFYSTTNPSAMEKFDTRGRIPSLRKYRCQNESSRNPPTSRTIRAISRDGGSQGSPTRWRVYNQRISASHCDSRESVVKYAPRHEFDRLQNGCTR